MPCVLRRPGGRGSCVASAEGVAEEARTRGFAAPTFAGCAFVEGVGVELRVGTLPIKTLPDQPHRGLWKRSPPR
jgi:hypothetical protein